MILAFRTAAAPPHTLIVAANRDELKERPSSGPRVWDGGFVAPRDEKAGGTWLGLNRHGLFAAVTNRFLAPRHPERAPRGQLVVKALGHRSALHLHGTMAELQPRQYNAFHLLYADEFQAFVTWSDGEAVHQEQLQPGLHIITERSLGGDDRSRSGLIRSRWPAQLTEASLAALLATTNPHDPLGGVCVDAPAFNYGTRSSAILFIRPELSRSRLLFADGPPASTPFVDHSGMLVALAG